MPVELTLLKNKIPMIVEMMKKKMLCEEERIDLLLVGWMVVKEKNEQEVRLDD